MFGPTRPVAIRPASATRCSAARPIVRGLIGECSWGWRWQSATRISLGSLWKKGPIRYCDQAMVSSLSPAAAERAKDCNASTSGSGSSPGRLGVRRTFRDPDRSPIAVGVPGHPRLPGPRQRACEGCMLGPFSDFGIGDAALLPAYWSSERARPRSGNFPAIPKYRPRPGTLTSFPILLSPPPRGPKGSLTAISWGRQTAMLPPKITRHHLEMHEDRFTKSVATPAIPFREPQPESMSRARSVPQYSRAKQHRPWKAQNRVVHVRPRIEFSTSETIPSPDSDQHTLL